MDTSPRLGLSFLMPNQAQKHVTLNEALRRLDVLVQPGALSASTPSQPANPAECDIYLLLEEASGSEWASAVPGTIAAFAEGGMDPPPAQNGLDMSHCGRGCLGDLFRHSMDPRPRTAAMGRERSAGRDKPALTRPV